MVNVQTVEEFERTKLDILQLFDTALHTHVLSGNMREVRALAVRIVLWIGEDRPESGILHTISEEVQHASAAQRALLEKQKAKLRKLRDKLNAAVGVLNEHHLDGTELHESGVLAQVDVLIEELTMNAKEVLAVPGQRKRRA